MNKEIIFDICLFKIEMTLKKEKMSLHFSNATYKEGKVGYEIQIQQGYRQRRIPNDEVRPP